VTHFITSLLHLWSFNHDQCNAILQRRGIEVTNAYDPDKTGVGRDSVYFGFFWIVGWLALVGGMLFLAWRREDKRARTGRIVLPFFLVFGLLILYLHLQAMAQYVDKCRQLLGLDSLGAVPQDGSPWIGVLIITSFAGAWFTGLTMMFKNASNEMNRVMAVVMMVAGGLFLGYYEFEMIAQLVR
jgi:hypothetical protein